MIHKFKSEHPMTPYAPSYDYTIAQFVWDESDKIDIIRNFLLSKEKDILKLDFRNDGGTGLNYSNITTRHSNYNVFDYGKEVPEFNDLLEFMRKSWWDYIKQDDTQDFALQINAWFNVLRKGQKMNYHNHNSSCEAYLSGNMHLDDYHTKTNYSYMNVHYPIDNIKGGLVLFPSVIGHETDVYNDEHPRVSIAFDLECTFLENPESTAQTRTFIE